jgi:hypothetical protein
MTALEAAAPESRLQVRVPGRTTAFLAGRAERAMTGASLNQQARNELKLWQAALAAELHGIRLTVAQASCVADVLGGSLLTESVSRPGRVYAECYDAFRIAGAGRSSYAEKHGIDERGLLDYLGTLGPAADHALADAIGRWWDQELEATAEGFAVAGLRVTA